MSTPDGSDQEEEDSSLIMEDEETDRPAKQRLGFFHDAQGDVMELANMITDPVLKKGESIADLHQLTLHQIARDGNEEVMVRFLSSMTGNRRKKVNHHDEDGLSPLHFAARYNHVKIVKLLVEYSADVNDVDEEMATPLHFAARYKRMRFAKHSATSDTEGDEEVPFESTPENSVIMYLVSKGATINARDVYGCTPLHFAAMRGNEVATKELLSCSGIHIEAVDKQQMTALHLAAAHKEVAICRMLIEMNANLRCCDEDLLTPLHSACKEGSITIAKMLFDEGERRDGWVTAQQMVTDQDKQQNNALHLAVENRSYEVAKLCIEKGALINSPRSNYQTPLHLAATAGDRSIAELLIQHGARIDPLDLGQETPLYKAAACNHVDVVEFLLERKANINRHDKDSFSPLLIAACKGHVDTMKTLLEHGANIFDVDKNDKSALFWAAEEDHAECIKILIDNPSYQQLLHLNDRHDNSPLHIACENGYLACANLLLDSGAIIDAKNEEEQTPLHLAAKNGKSYVVRELVKRDKNIINDEDEDSNTPLHLAALAGHTLVAETLIKCGANIQARNATLWTPLDCAADKGHTKVCLRLLEADATIDPLDKAKTTPLHLSATRGHVDVVNLLLQWHANAGLRDSEGKNCLDLAIENGHKDVAMAVINSAQWDKALRNETLDLATGFRLTPMRKLIRKLPDVAKRALHRCTEQNMSNPDHPNFAITFNFEFLDDMYSNWKDRDNTDTMSVSESSVYDEDGRVNQVVEPYSTDATVLKMNHPLMIMVQANREDLLAHPLVTALLRHKWDSYGKYFYYINLLFYCIFLLFLTGYICTAKPPYTYKNDTLRMKDMTECEEAQLLTEVSQSVAYTVFISAGKIIIIVIAALRLLGEIIQLINAKLSYFAWENLVEWTTYITALLLVIDFCPNQADIRMEWQWQIGAIAIFSAWIALVLFIQKIPKFGIYVVMFLDVFTTFVNFFPVFFLFIIAFAMAFFALLQNQIEFDQPGLSLLKTSVMMIGEFEFHDLFLAVKEDEELVNRIFYPTATFIIFVLFMIVMTILIMNLLVGLAVDDIKAVQEQAALKRLAMQVELVLDVARVLPLMVQRKFLRKSLTLEPNQSIAKYCSKLHVHSNTASSINAALRPDVTEMERLQENQERVIGNMQNLRHRVKVIGEKQQRLENMMMALLQANNIEWQDEDT